ncbi:MAG: hypothetical protein ACFFB3_19335, partial [Candidatus Hodarchaeota archaeon]
EPVAAIVNSIAFVFIYIMLFFVLAARYATWHEAKRSKIAYWEGLNLFEDPALEPADNLLLVRFDDGHIE